MGAHSYSRIYSCQEGGPNSHGRGSLHHCGVLVHIIDFIRKSCCYGWAFVYDYIRLHQPKELPCVLWRTGGRTCTCSTIQCVAVSKLHHCGCIQGLIEAKTMTVHMRGMFCITPQLPIFVTLGCPVLIIWVLNVLK